MGVPDDVIRWWLCARLMPGVFAVVCLPEGKGFVAMTVWRGRLGTRAMEVAIERHSLGYRYELTPTYFEEHEKDGTPKMLNKA